MTCIVGIAKNNKVFIGGDSASIDDFNVQIRTDAKVFRIGNAIIGFTSSFRMGQLLRYTLKFPIHPEEISDMEFMVARFIPAVRKCFKDGGFANDEEDGGTFIVGYRGQIYEINDDYQVAQPIDNISCVGSGADVALGVVYALPDLNLKEKIIKALEITTYLNTTVRPPFIVEEL